MAKVITPWGDSQGGPSGHLRHKRPSRADHPASARGDSIEEQAEEGALERRPEGFGLPDSGLRGFGPEGLGGTARRSW